MEMQDCKSARKQEGGNCKKIVTLILRENNPTTGIT